MKCNHELDLSIAYMSNPPKFKCKLCGDIVVPKEENISSVALTEEYKKFWKQCAVSALVGCGGNVESAAHAADKMLIKYKNKKF